MRKTTIYLPEELDRDLKAKARRTGIAAAELVRAAVRRSLEDEDLPRPKSFGAGSGGDFQAAADEAILEREWRPGRP